jgi:hypothetical protein
MQGAHKVWAEELFRARTFFVLNKAAEPPLFRKFLPVSTLSSPRLLNESLSHDQLPV